MRMRTDAKRESILEAAAAVFFEMGFERAAMAEIAARIGASKATLYGYFLSKEELFLEVAERVAHQHLAPVFESLKQDAGDIGQSLRRMGERAMTILCRPQGIAAMRIMLTEVGREDTSRRFYEQGPRRAEERLAAYLQAAMDTGRLRQADSQVAAMHLMSLLESETIRRCLFELPQGLPRSKLKQTVDRAVTVFMAAYGPLP